MKDDILYKNTGNSRRGVRLVALALGMLLAACSTTRKLPEGEMLYVGVKKMEVVAPEKVKLSSAQNSAASSPLAVKLSAELLMAMFTVVFSISASAICEARVRLRIKSYNFFSCALPSILATSM